MVGNVSSDKPGGMKASRVSLMDASESQHPPPLKQTLSSFQEIECLLGGHQKSRCSAFDFSWWLPSFYGPLLMDFFLPLFCAYKSIAMICGIFITIAVNEGQITSTGNRASTVWNSLSLPSFLLSKRSQLLCFFPSLLKLDRPYILLIKDA